jgi:hypothetical protein
MEVQAHRCRFKKRLGSGVTGVSSVVDWQYLGEDRLNLNLFHFGLKLNVRVDSVELTFLCTL